MLGQQRLKQQQIGRAASGTSICPTASREARLAAEIHHAQVDELGDAVADEAEEGERGITYTYTSPSDLSHSLPTLHLHITCLDITHIIGVQCVGMYVFVHTYLRA